MVLPWFLFPLYLHVFWFLWYLHAFSLFFLGFWFLWYFYGVPLSIGMSFSFSGISMDFGMAMVTLVWLCFADLSIVFLVSLISPQGPWCGHGYPATPWSLYYHVASVIQQHKLNKHKKNPTKTFALTAVSSANTSTQEHHWLIRRATYMVPMMLHFCVKINASQTSCVDYFYFNHRQLPALRPFTL